MNIWHVLLPLRRRKGAAQTSYDAGRRGHSPHPFILHLVMAREKPIAVPQGGVEELFDLADSAGIVDLSRGLMAGSEMRLRAGPFTGGSGLLTSVGYKGRVEMQLRIMNGVVRKKTAQELLDVCGAQS